MIDCLLIMIKNISNLVPAAFLIENSEARHLQWELLIELQVSLSLSHEKRQSFVVKI